MRRSANDDRAEQHSEKTILVISGNPGHSNEH
jgi:hypothetical protein